MKNILEISGIGDSCEDNLSLCGSFSNDADRFAKMLCQSFDDIKTVSAAMLEKKRVICRIYNEQISVSNKTIKFYQAWTCRNFPSDENESLKLFVMFKEMEAHLEPLNNFMEEFDGELKRAAEIIKRFDLCILAHLITLIQSFSILTKAKSRKDLERVKIPTLEWMEIFDDPEIEELAEMWDDMDLTTRMAGIMQQTQRLLARR